MATLDDVRNYWESNHLYSYEKDSETNPEQFFNFVDEIKTNDVERFSQHYFDFEAYRGKKVLDIGCGPGWLTVQYAKGGATVTSVDLTPKAVGLTKKHLEIRGLEADVRVANAEELPFDDNEFDLVMSSGVLHHTPDTMKAIREAHRVCKSGGDAKITLYHRGILHSKMAFPLVLGAMKVLGVKHPGADLAAKSKDPNEFIRMYDGEGNPVGRGYTTDQCRKIFTDIGFDFLGHELHFFPARFMPKIFSDIKFVHYMLDRNFGTMIYPYLRKR